MFCFFSFAPFVLFVVVVFLFSSHFPTQVSKALMPPFCHRGLTPAFGSCGNKRAGRRRLRRRYIVEHKPVPAWCLTRLARRDGSLPSPPAAAPGAMVGGLLGREGGGGGHDLMTSCKLSGSQSERRAHARRVHEIRVQTRRPRLQLSPFTAFSAGV